MKQAEGGRRKAEGKEKIEVRLSGIRSGGPMCPPDWMQKIISKTLRFEKAKLWVISVLITNNREIRRINKKFLNHDRVTDVIAFNLGCNGSTQGSAPTRICKPRRGGPSCPPTYGDIIVSAQMARSVSKKLGIPFKQELARYVVHGVLHLLGYRDKTVKDRKRMWKKQEHVIARLHSSRSNLYVPYRLLRRPSGSSQ